MPARDKYWVFSKKDRESGYRKGAHKVPKWTKYISNVFISLTFSKGFDERGAIWVLDSNAEGKKRSHGTHRFLSDTLGYHFTSMGTGVLLAYVDRYLKNIVCCEDSVR